MRHPVTKESKRLLSARIAVGDPGAIADVVIAVGREGGNRGMGAARLGISRRTLENWVRDCPKLAAGLAKLPKRRGAGRPVKMPVLKQLPNGLALQKGRG
jgi:hypothetical protein